MGDETGDVPSGGFLDGKWHLKMASNWPTMQSPPSLAGDGTRPSAFTSDRSFFSSDGARWGRGHGMG